MAKRHIHAIGVQQGACNPAGIARTLVEAIDECRAEREDPHRCPAVKLILHQLNSIIHADLDGADYTEAYEACLERREAVMA